MADLKQKILNSFQEKPMVQWRCRDGIFFGLGAWRGISGKFSQQIELFSSDNRIYADYQKEIRNSLDVNIRLVWGN